MKPIVIATFALPFLSLISGYAQTPPEARTLSIAGRPGSATVMDVNGTSYVSLDALARLLRGSLSYSGNQTILTLSAEQGTGASAPRAGFSKEFLAAGIEQMSTIREWRVTIINSIQNNFRVSDELIAQFRRKADQQLAVAAAARSTNDDRSGYPLLAGEFANMQKFSDRFLENERKVQYIDPASIDNDPLDRQILTCARSLAAMASENQFREEAACTELQ